MMARVNPDDDKTMRGNRVDQTQKIIDKILGLKLLGKNTGCTDDEEEKRHDGRVGRRNKTQRWRHRLGEVEGAKLVAELLNTEKKLDGKREAAVITQILEKE